MKTEVHAGNGRMLAALKRGHAPWIGQTDRRVLADVPPCPANGSRFDYPDGGFIVDKDLMRWRFDRDGKFVLWILYRTQNERAMGMHPWAEIWTSAQGTSK